MFAAKREQAIYEAAILEHLSRLEQRIDQMSQRTSSTSGLLPSVLSAGSSVNGTITVGDVLVSGAIFVVGAGAGAVAAPVLYAAGVPWNDATITLRIGTYGGLGLCWLKLAIDGLLYDVFNSWRNRPEEEEKPAPPTNTVIDRPLPIYDKDHEPPIEVRLCGLPNGRTIAWDDLTDYLETAQANFARWGTKAWSREAWVGKPYPEYPQLGNIPSRTWTGVLQLCTEWIKQFPAYTDKAGRSLVWQTGDHAIIRDFVDLLDAEL